MGAKAPLDQWNLLITGGFQAPTGAKPPPFEREKKFKPLPLQIPEYTPDIHIQLRKNIFFKSIWLIFETLAPN